MYHKYDHLVHICTTVNQEMHRFTLTKLCEFVAVRIVRSNNSRHKIQFEIFKFDIESRMNIRVE